MKFVDYTSLLTGDPANIALIATYQLDPDFFEQRLLRCTTLSKARRIIVFMDAGQWSLLLSSQVPARFLNRRYLVVPVRAPGGVFHAKLSFFASERSGMIHCGSNNTTRAGCSSNLELLNAIRIDPEKDFEQRVGLVQDALTFFKRTCNDAEFQTGRMAQKWIEEAEANIVWLRPKSQFIRNPKLRLFHSYDGRLWDRITTQLEQSPPEKLFVISPFHDLDGELTKRVFNRWPGCKIEFVVQQKTTTLPIQKLKPFRSKITLAEIRNSSRRLHAKLVAWKSKRGTDCLVGSANFTTAAFDGRNVESCLFLSDAGVLVDSLFDGQLSKKPLRFDDFEPGKEQEPSPVDGEPSDLRIASAILKQSGELRLAYQCRLPTKPSNLQIALHTPEERRPRLSLDLPVRENGTMTLSLPETAVSDVRTTILASLVAETAAGREEGPATWVIQEQRLTYEPSGSEAPSLKSRIEETGQGLAELLEELGKRDGVAAVIEFLQRLNIQFNDGSGWAPGQRPFRLRITDPFRPDVAPDWLIGAKTDMPTLADAIYEFADRHEDRRLRRHANRGNINGMENFLDVFTALTRLLYVYYVRGVVKSAQMVGRVCRYIEIATSGSGEDDESSEGYLSQVVDNLGGKSEYVQEVVGELNFLGHLRAALVIAQKVRFIPGEKLPRMKLPERPSETLPHVSEQIRTTIKTLRLQEPSKEQVIQALKEYNMFTDQELAQLAGEITF